MYIYILCTINDTITIIYTSALIITPHSTNTYLLHKDTKYIVIQTSMIPSTKQLKNTRTSDISSQVV